MADSSQGDQEEDTLRLDQFLKIVGVAETGGHAKLMIQGGEVQVNGELETRRRRKLRVGDTVTVQGETIEVAQD
ncbi:RNA-binding S4 domain-containing protein [Planctomicrobium sp. SH527]|uniref:RNA-binding S4 domain-containing protein n=1 Tax=Planctomicrobium sp. SH527 TaxID=3448123 RepID=UPI003F5C5E80